MKKKLLLCALGFVMAGLLSAGPAAAFTIGYLEGYNSSNSGADTAQVWLEGLAGTPSLLNPLHKEEGIDWDSTLNLDDGTYYIVLKVGNAQINKSPNDPENWDTFAFKTEIDGDGFTTTYAMLMDNDPGMASILTLLFLDYKGNVINWKGKASHISIYEASSVPIPGAVWLLGSGILGLAGIRIRSRKRKPRST